MGPRVVALFQFPALQHPVRRVDAPVFLLDGDRQFDLGAVFALDGFRVRAQLRHRGAERAEVVDHRLVNEHVAVGEEKDAFFPPAFHKRQMI